MKSIENSCATGAQTQSLTKANQNNSNNNGPFSPFLKTIDFVWCQGPTSADMGPNSQATTEATKSIVDRELCQLLTY